RTGSLERFLEDSILRFGIDYAQKLADQLDVEAAGLVSELRKEKMEMQESLSLLESEIDSAERGCLEGKPKERVRNFTALFSKLQEKIRLAGRDAIVTQQIALLNDLSEGDSGVLDHYRRNLSVLKAAVQERLEGKVEAGNSEANLKDGYNVNLPKDFQATAEDVTTTFLPDVKTFVVQGHWASDHRFAQLYSLLVKQVQTKGGGTEPLRQRPEDYGRGAGTQGLHHALRRMLTDAEITGHANGFEQAGEIVFFRDFFTIEKRQPAQAMINRIEQYARAYIVSLMRDSRDVMSEIQKPLTERVDNLSPEEREGLKNKFNSGTQTFCKMSTVGGGQATTYNLYVGSDQSLAVKMGYAHGSTSQFVPIDVPNRFLSIRAKTLWTMDQYPYQERYSQIYSTTRKERQEKKSAFAPHIHRLFNLYGVADGMRMLVQPKSEDLKKLFVTMLLYREMFEAAKEARQDDLLREIFYLDERFAGNRQTCHSPLIIQAGVNSGKEALVCETLKRANGKLLLERSSFVNVAGDVKYHSDILAGLAGKPQLVASLQEVDDFFRDNCSRSWLQLVEDSHGKLADKLNPKSSWPTETKEFYMDLRNHLEDIFAPLKNLVSGKQRRILDSSDAEAGKASSEEEGATF
ncbi:MAG TPA: hypothetical protein VEZ40_21260, partial [Pyrinomonadaceae bacterium]|nr:hypothetical protein [Pyrinomonadaceae bacterium]